MLTDYGSARKYARAMADATATRKIPSDVSGVDDYRCFVVPAAGDELQVLTAYQGMRG